MQLTLLCDSEGLVIVPGVLMLLSMDNLLHCSLLESAQLVVHGLNFSLGYMPGFVELLSQVCDGPGGGKSPLIWGVEKYQGFCHHVI